jgi:L-rhamnonate dehydratase
MNRPATSVMLERRTQARIERVSFTKVFVPYKHVVKWSAGVRPGTTRLIAQIETQDGVIGYGETNCLWDFVEPLFAKTITPLVLGEDAFSIERILKRIEGAGYYHHKRAMVAAVAALEMALWDVVGKQAGLPLSHLWGGAFRDAVPVVAYIQSNDPEMLAAEAETAISQGFQTIKLKIGMGEESDIEFVRTVRQTVGPRIRLRADVNGAWCIGTAKRQMRKLEQYDLEYVEQPLPLEDLAGHAYLRKLSSIPIALDESAYTLQDVSAIVRAEAADVILLDPHEAGGLLPTRKAAAVAEAAGIPVTLHSGAELGISTAANLHLATTIPNLILAIDSQYPNETDDVLDERFSWEGGLMRVPAGPGLGVTPSARKMAALATDTIANPYLDPSRPDWFPTKPQY